MSLDIDLITDKPIKVYGKTGVFFRENGQTIELTAKQVKEKFGKEVETYDYETNEAFSINITSNLATMANEAGIFEALWTPNGHGYKQAKDIIKILTTGLDLLLEKPDHFKQFNPENGWGTYDTFVDIVQEYLEACKKYPDATIKADY